MVQKNAKTSTRKKNNNGALYYMYSYIFNRVLYKDNTLSSVSIDFIGCFSVSSFFKHTLLPPTFNKQKARNLNTYELVVGI